MNNPWADLPREAPYIAQIDRDAVATVLEREPGGREDLRFDVLPHPYAGDPARARVLILALNPGWADTDEQEERDVPDWQSEVRRALTFEASTPFVHVDPRFRESTGGGRWWSRRLRTLAAATSWDVVGQRLLCLEFFGYHSITWRSLPVPMPSQSFVFDILRHALAQELLVVATRGWSQWVWNVPELYSYPHVIRLHTARWTGISPGNMGSDAFARIVAAVDE